MQKEADGVGFGLNCTIKDRTQLSNLGPDVALSRMAGHLQFTNSTNK